MSLVRLIAAVALTASIAAPAAAETITYEKETEPYPGLRILERHTSGPNWRIWVAFVSLCNDGIHIDARSSQATRITAAAWGSAMGAQLAVNGDFYRTDRSTPTVYGDAVGVGLHWPKARTGLGAEFTGDWYYRKYGWIAFGPDWVELNHTKYVKNHAAELGVTQGWYPDTMTTAIPEGTLALVSGFPELVVEGKKLTSFPDRGDMADRHPRTAMGLSKDRKTFILAVVDGRSTASVGMNGAELAALMKEMGAYTAFNLDGGGSSQMWLSGKGTLNDPSDGSPRSVANHWGVYAGSGHSRGAAPGSCFVAGGCFPSPLPAAADSPFADMPVAADAFDEAELLVDNGLLATCEPEPRPMFCPACSLTRRQAAALVVRAAGIDTGDPPATPTFSDVPASDPDFAEIEAAAREGITSGCGDGKFCPDKAINRAQLAAFVARARGWAPVTTGDPHFTDVATDHTFYGEVEALAEHCAAVECSEDQYCPGKAARRDDAAVIAVRAFNLDGANPCADARPDPDAGVPGDADSGASGGDGDAGAGGGGGGGELSAGCAVGGRGGAGVGALVLVLLMLVVARPRRS